MAARTEPRNPFYFVMLVVGLIFVATVLAYAMVPVLEDKARDAGTEPPPSWFRSALKNDGWRWVLAEVAALVVLALLSMGLDRYRRWKQENEKPPEQSAASKVETPPPP